jgi:iron-sulfur cluster repair protein YtfE (RIC family)
MKSIYTILNEEHERVKTAFANLLEHPLKGDWNVIVNDLSMHMESEEKVLYPRLSEFEELKNNIVEATEEHKHAKTLLKDLEKMEMSDEEFMPKLKVLKEMIEHHIGEEEKVIFPKAQKIITSEQERDLVNDYIDAEEEYKKHRDHGVFSFLHPKHQSKLS